MIEKLRPAIFAGRIFLAAALLSGTVVAAPDTDQLLKHADDIKTANNSEFLDLLNRIEGESETLSSRQRIYLHYLRGWQLGYTGEYEKAVETLKAVIAEADDPTVRFRAQISLVNDHALASHYEEAYAGLDKLLEVQAQVTDRATRLLGFGVASLLYGQAGQYDLGLNYAERWLAEDSTDSGACKASYLKVDALFRGGRLNADSPLFREVIDRCQKAGEPLYPNVMRMYVANLMVSAGKIADAIQLLRDHDAEVQQTHSARVGSEFHSILARCYLIAGDRVQARQYAQSAIDKAIKKEYSKPLVDAYEVLYKLSKQEGDISSALAWHEKFAAADKGYLNDTTARTLAYQMVNQQVLDKKRQIEALSEKNEVLKLQGEVASKAAETERLYVVLLVFGLASIALWAWRTKRSQMRFQKLARRDGLTGIVNRQHFMDEAKVRIQYGAKSGRDLSLILIDLDNFKLINDTHGHVAGDTVLKQTVTICQQHMRSIDLFGRVGGEEFAVLLPDCSLDTASRRAEELRAAIADFARAGGEISASASFGVTSTRDSGYDLRQMLIHADSALYQAKRTGRNRVQIFETLREVAIQGA